MRNVLLAGVGGQGTVLAAKVLAQAAQEKGWQVRTAETIGMAQRGGNVVSHVRMGDGGRGRAWRRLLARGRGRPRGGVRAGRGRARAALPGARRRARHRHDARSSPSPAALSRAPLPRGLPSSRACRRSSPAPRPRSVAVDDAALVARRRAAARRSTRCCWPARCPTAASRSTCGRPAPRHRRLREAAPTSPSTWPPSTPQPPEGASLGGNHAHNVRFRIARLYDA